MARLSSALILSALMVPTAALAQQPAPVDANGYRTGMPPVLTPAPDASAASFSKKDFSKAYQAAGRPRMVLFWNRELSDQVAPTWVKETTSSGVAVAGAEGRRDDNAAVVGASETNRGYYGSRTDAAVVGSRTTTAQVDGYAAFATNTRQSERAETDGLHKGLVEYQDRDMQAAFESVLVSEGVRTVNRAAIVRTQGADVKGERPNQNAIETKALLGKGEIYVELIAMSDPGSDFSVSFSVRATRIKTGTVVASFVARPNKNNISLTTYTAGATGGFQQEIRADAGAQVGRYLAYQLLGHLTGSLRS